MPDSIDDLLARMRAVEQAGPPHDGICQFNRVYQRVSAAIRDRLAAGLFADPRFIRRFTVVFAGRYFAAVDAAAAGRRPDPAWRPLFAARADPRIKPVQYVVAGMNAHINQDLALAVVDTCVELGTHPRSGHVPADYRRVNEVIEQVESQARRSLLTELEQELGEPVEPLVHLLSSWSIAQAREAAWIRTQVLWLLRDEDWLFEHHVDTTARAVGMTSRHLLLPVLPASPVQAAVSGG